MSDRDKDMHVVRICLWAWILGSIIRLSGSSRSRWYRWLKVVGCGREREQAAERESLIQEHSLHIKLNFAFGRAVARGLPGRGRKGRRGEGRGVERIGGE